MMSPQTNSAFQRDEQNGYQVHLDKPRKQADCLISTFVIFYPFPLKSMKVTSSILAFNLENKSHEILNDFFFAEIYASTNMVPQGPPAKDDGHLYVS